ncbi:hypothetical protein B0H10DRAFT_1963194 [Mycena sp. CBHHK59/15]|nr:hypothetical protein B0H10DRAFT_1963194 [Mycena sp. CBHHK59/15]
MRLKPVFSLFNLACVATSDYNSDSGSYSRRPPPSAGSPYDSYDPPTRSYTPPLGAPTNSAYRPPPPPTSIRQSARAGLEQIHCDAIDEDGSGYISVHDANKFFNSRPSGWTPPQCSAVGWYIDAVQYRHRCMSAPQALIDSIVRASKKVMPQNKSALKPHLKQDCYGKIHLNYDRGPYHGESTGSEFDSLRKFRRERLHDEMDKTLIFLVNLISESPPGQVQLRLDSKEVVMAVLGAHRVEVSVLCLLYLVLRRHKEIIDLAGRLALDELEFESWSIPSRIYQMCSRCGSQSAGELAPTAPRYQTPVASREAYSKRGTKNQSDADSDSDQNFELGTLDDEEYKPEERTTRAEEVSDLRKARDILLYDIPRQPSKGETRKLREDQEAKKT